MVTVLYLPVFSEKDDIVLPERGRGVPTADQSIITENGCQIVGLKVIDLLASDKIHRICPKQFRYQFFAIFPGIEPIFCQTEAKIEGHHGNVVGVEVHDGMDITKHTLMCQIDLRVGGLEGDICPFGRYLHFVRHLSFGRHLRCARHLLRLSANGYDK